MATTTESQKMENISISFQHFFTPLLNQTFDNNNNSTNMTNLTDTNIKSSSTALAIILPMIIILTLVFIAYVSIDRNYLEK
jgi:hypothetical protein